MARATQAAYDAFLDALKGTFYYLTPDQPVDATALNASRLNDAGSVAASNGSNGAGTPDGRQFTVAAASGIPITKSGQAAYVTQATGAGDASDVPVHSMELSGGGQAVEPGNTANISSYVLRIAALAGQ